MLFLVFLYVGILTYIRKYQEENSLEQKLKVLIKRINQILNTLFSFFWWIFFTPCIEINSGVFVCGDNSFLVEFRDESLCNSKPFFYKFLSVIGLLMTLALNIIVIAFFRNYEFED